jgi:hypothetical protein
MKGAADFNAQADADSFARKSYGYREGVMRDEERMRPERMAVERAELGVRRKVAETAAADFADDDRVRNRLAAAREQSVSEGQKRGLSPMDVYTKLYLPEAQKIYLESRMPEKAQAIDDFMRSQRGRAYLYQWDEMNRSLAFGDLVGAAKIAEDMWNSHNPDKPAKVEPPSLVPEEAGNFTGKFRITTTTDQGPQMVEYTPSQFVRIMQSLSSGLLSPEARAAAWAAADAESAKYNREAAIEALKSNLRMSEQQAKAAIEGGEFMIGTQRVGDDEQTIVVSKRPGPDGRPIVFPLGRPGSKFQSTIVPSALDSRTAYVARGSNVGVFTPGEKGVAPSTTWYGDSRPGRPGTPPQVQWAPRGDGYGGAPRAQPAQPGAAAPQTPPWVNAWVAANTKGGAAPAVEFGAYEDPTTGATVQGWLATDPTTGETVALSLADPNAQQQGAVLGGRGTQSTGAPAQGYGLRPDLGSGAIPPVTQQLRRPRPDLGAGAIPPVTTPARAAPPGAGPSAAPPIPPAQGPRSDMAPSSVPAVTTDLRGPSMEGPSRTSKDVGFGVRNVTVAPDVEAAAARAEGQAAAAREQDWLRMQDEETARTAAQAQSEGMAVEWGARDSADALSAEDAAGIPPVVSTIPGAPSGRAAVTPPRPAQPKQAPQAAPKPAPAQKASPAKPKPAPKAAPKPKASKPPATAGDVRKADQKPRLKELQDQARANEKRIEELEIMARTAKWKGNQKEAERLQAEADRLVPGLHEIRRQIRAIDPNLSGME